MALALPDDGELITCDVSEQWTKDARSFWQAAQQDHKIKLRIGPALDSMYALLNDGQQFDFIFIDADKTNYVQYYELALKLISPKGIIAIDNIFWDGEVADPKQHNAQLREIRALTSGLKPMNVLKSVCYPWLMVYF